MARFIAGDIVVVLFPFSNLSYSKKRPALVLAKSGESDYILCQITSKKYSSTNAIIVTKPDIIDGNLPVLSYIRPDKVFTADPSLISKKAGKITAKKFKEVKKELSVIFEL